MGFRQAQGQRAIRWQRRLEGIAGSQGKAYRERIVLLIKRGELGANRTLGAFETVGRFKNLREVKEHAWAYCHENAKPCIYLCYRLGFTESSLHSIITLNCENGCIRLREEAVQKADFRRSLERIVERFLDGLAAEGRA
jgi:hypothetical protein